MKVKALRKESKLQTQNYLIALTTLAKALPLDSRPEELFVFFDRRPQYSSTGI